MDDTEKSYLEIKVTFHHILILLVGVILIGSFLFYLGYQAGKTSSKNLEQKILLAKEEGKTREIEELSKKEPDKAGETAAVTGTSTGNGTPSIDEELKLHGEPAKDDPAGTTETTPASPDTPPKSMETPRETFVPPVETKPVKQKPEEKIETIKTAKPAKKGQFFSIQVGAFYSHALAKDYSSRFSRAGYAISISQAEVKGKTWYRVRVGNFNTRDEAQKEKSKLEKMENQKFSIVKSD